jgi:hypothetical protein
MAVTFEHDDPRNRSQSPRASYNGIIIHDHHGDSRAAWYERYHNFRVMRRSGDARKDSGTALLATLALGLFFWVIVFAVLISVNPAGH